MKRSKNKPYQIRESAGSQGWGRIRSYASLASRGEAAHWAWLDGQIGLGHRVQVRNSPQEEWRNYFEVWVKRGARAAHSRPIRRQGLTIRTNNYNSESGQS